MPKVIKILILLLLCAMLTAAALSPESSLALSRYKRIMEENKSYRSYGAESGYKGNTRYQFTDADGYNWYVSRDEGFSIYRFNGFRFENMISGAQIAAHDSLLPILLHSAISHQVYAAGKHNLYLWKGYFWKRYIFPAGDRIQNLQIYGDEVFCIGERGIGILKQGIWKYRGFRSVITAAESNESIAGKNGTLFSWSSTGQNNSEGATDIRIKQFSSLRTGFILIGSAETNSDPLQTCYDYGNELLWIYKADSDLLYKFNTGNLQARRIPILPGTVIDRIATTDDGKNWLVTRGPKMIAAIELRPEYPANGGVEYSSVAISFSPDFLDCLYLEDQLLPLNQALDPAAPKKKYSHLRFLMANSKTGQFTVTEEENPYKDSICQEVYAFGSLLLMDFPHDTLPNIHRILITRYPFERITRRDIVVDSEVYDLAYNRQMDAVLYQRKGTVSIIPLVIVCEPVAQTPGTVFQEVDKQQNAAHFDARNLHYYYANKWLSLDISQFDLYGIPGNALTFNDIIWLCYENALLRFDPKTGVSYAYTAREGVPDALEKVFIQNDKIMIKAKDAIYRFNEYKNLLKLDIPYIIVSDSVRYSVREKLILPYTQRRFEVPVAILGPLYPELVRISYRLIGYNDDWIIKDYQEKIRYLKLPSGSYTFEISAIAANGAQTPVKSFRIVIQPPWFSSWYAIIIYVLFGLATVFLIYRWRLYNYKEANRQLELQVEERTHELQEWQMRMTQSIDYALLIQRSILPQEDQLKRLFKNHFILWYPRDVVGGDFYWLQELPAVNAVLFAVIDCTGHGVPGALVSMTVNAALNHIVKEHGVNSPGEIMQQLHQDIGLTLHQESEKSQQDGLDIALVKIDFNARTLDFAGAALDMLLFDRDKNELSLLKGSKYSIGGLKHHKNLIFEPQQISFSPLSALYLFTDGILDQTSENKIRMKRLGPEQWQNVIRDLSTKQFNGHKAILSDMIRQMLLLDDQRDDITVIGLQL